MDRASSSKSRGKTQKRGLKARRTCVLAYSRQVGQKDKFWNSNCYSHLALLGKVIKAREEVFLLSKKKVETRIFYLWFLVRKTTDGELKKTECIFFSSGNTFSNVIATQLLLAASSRLFFTPTRAAALSIGIHFSSGENILYGERKNTDAALFFLPHSFSGSRQTSCMANEILVIFTTFFSAVLSVLRQGNLGRDWHQWI